MLGGALGNWAAHQVKNDCFYYVADWHALTSDYADTSRLTAIDHVRGDGDWAAARLAHTVTDHPTLDPLGAPYAPSA